MVNRGRSDLDPRWRAVCFLVIDKQIPANRDPRTPPTEWKYEEEREPAQHENSDDDAECLGGFLLALELGHFSRHRDAQVRRPIMMMLTHVRVRRRRALAAGAGLGAGGGGGGLQSPGVDSQRHLGRRPGTVEVCRFDSGREKSGLAHRLAVDAVVHDEDDGQRDVEGPGDGEQHVPGLLGDVADARVGARFSRLLPAEERRHGDGERQEPDADDDPAGAALAHDRRVLERPRHADVPVDADDAQAEDRRRAAEHVQRRHGGLSGDVPLVREDI